MRPHEQRGQRPEELLAHQHDRGRKPALYGTGEPERDVVPVDGKAPLRGHAIMRGQAGGRGGCRIEHGLAKCLL